MTPRRKGFMAVIGVLLVGLGWTFYPFVTSPDQMERFCKSLAVGSSLGHVRAQAEERGYRATSLLEGRAIVHEPRSFGRFTCNLQFGPDGLVSSAYAFND